MKMLDTYRKMNHEHLKQQSIIKVYEEILAGSRKTFPKGTWKNDENVVMVIRYVLEVKLALNDVEIPRITKETIRKQKLWGALNRFKSIKRMLHFVYPNKFTKFSFHRVPANYWEKLENIKSRFEELLAENNIPFSDIPKFITYDLLIEWGLSNPLKRHNHSPYQLINAMYPNVFSPHQFRKIPNNFGLKKHQIKEQFLYMLKKERIAFDDIPKKVTLEMLQKFRFYAALNYHDKSPSKLIMELFPNEFTIEDFNKPQGYWHNIKVVRRTVLNLLEKYNIPFSEIPQRLTKKMFMEQGLGGLLDRYDGSPIKIVQDCFPGKFDITDFKRLPNRFWYDKDNRIQSLRSYCKKHNISPDQLPMLSRAYFKRNMPRFVSVLDRHYESKIHLWITEAFPEFMFTPSDFSLLVGEDGQLCDSHEELLVHNHLLKVFAQATIKREGQRFVNEEFNESYIPDWIIHMDGRKIIVEYFGLYGSDRFEGYTERANRKIEFYQSLADYELILIFPEDIANLDDFFAEYIKPNFGQT